MDTGEKYVKLPLSTYVKLGKQENKKVEAQRLHGNSAEIKHNGCVPVDGLQFVQALHVPPHILLGERFMGHPAQYGPYFEAGPKSAFLSTGAILKITMVNAAHTSANFINPDDKEKCLSFGTIHTALLHFVTLVASSLDVFGNRGENEKQQKQRI